MKAQIKIAIINQSAGEISGGYKKYLNKILPRLSKNEQIKSVFCALPTSVNLNKDLDVIFKECKPYRPYNFFPDYALLRSIKEYEPDIIFCPLERPFKIKSIPTVTMLQNMEPFVKKSLFNTNKINFRLKIQKIVGSKALKKSDGIICLSSFVKDYVINELNIPEFKTSLIYHGISSSNSSVKKIKQILNDFNTNFIFTSGSIRPARGLEDLIKAIKVLKERGFNYKLLIAGGVNNEALNYKSYLEKIISQKRLSDSIIFLGEVDEVSMEWCFKNADLFVMTSKVESFGLIAAEAMVNGCLIVSSSSPCLPEIFGDVASYYKSGDYYELSEKILLIMQLNKVHKLSLRMKTKKRSNSFSWDICSERTINFFKKTIKNY